MAAWQYWLPEESLSDKAVISALWALMTDWLADWLPSSRRQAIWDIEVCALADIPHDADRISNKGHKIQLSSASQMISSSVLASGIANLEPAYAPVSDCEKVFVKNICIRAFRNLHLRLSEALLIETQSEKSGANFSGTASRQCFRLTCDTLSVDLYLSVPRCLFVRYRRSLCKALSVHPALGRRSEAVEKQAIQIGAFIGATQVNLESLNDLEEGDVVLLNSGYTEDLTLTVNGRKINDRVCQVKSTGEGLSLVLGNSSLN